MGKAHWKSHYLFGKGGGKHSKGRKRKLLKRQYSYTSVQKNDGSHMNLKVTKKRILHSYKRYRRNFTHDVIDQPNLYIMKKLSLDETLKFKLKKVQALNLNGYRMINLNKLQSHVIEITSHMVICEQAVQLAREGKPAIVLESEVRNCGLASVLSFRCKGCSQSLVFETSPKIKTRKYPRYDVNFRAVWGSVVTGNGNAHLSEILATMDSPSLSQPAFSNIEEELGEAWSSVLEEQFMEAGAEERRRAIEKGHFHEGVPCITVIADGGWCKRSHKHSYNALGGVGVIIGKETGKVLYMGIKNKYCYICSRAVTQNIVAAPHKCFQNWTESSQAMEAEIIVDGFKSAERMHGLRYTELIADGDSSVYAKIIDDVAGWGRSVQKVECANHACKCLRGSLERLVQDKETYKGKNKLTKNVRIKIVSAVRCAIRMRSKEANKAEAIKKLSHDIRNCIHHIFGNHKNCSDFCKATDNQAINATHSEINTSDKSDNVDNLSSVFSCQSELWTAGSTLQEQENSRYSTELNYKELDSDMLRDVTLLLNRIATKSARLIGNFTTNLAECWMHMRCKFDGGKMYNLCQRGSWHTRCYGSSLRANIGPQWSPFVWEKVTGTVAGFHYNKLYKQRDRHLQLDSVRKQTPEVRLARWKRKMKNAKQSTSKKARMSYGDEAIDVTPDIEKSELQQMNNSYLQQHIDISQERIDAVERITVEQSYCMAWKNERKKRITASTFGSVVKRNPKLAVEPLVRRLLYSNFKGTVETRKGLMEEDDTIQEYKLKQAEFGKNVTVQKCGLIISRNHKFLGGSPDGKVIENGDVGLVEIKNLIQNKRINLTEAAKGKNFCLKLDENGNLQLNRTHDYYYQCQGLLGVTQLQWIDFVVRCTKPYQLHIERIYHDVNMWENIMIPKLTSFFHKAILPELSVPRYGKKPGIREPGIWFEEKKTPSSKKQKPSTKKRPSSSSSSRKVNDVKKDDRVDSCQPQPTCSRRTRVRKINFIGRRISHKRTNKGSRKKWFSGIVFDVLKGEDGDADAVHEVLYDEEDEPYVVENLFQDYVAKSLKFIDL